MSIYTTASRQPYSVGPKLSPSQSLLCAWVSIHACMTELEKRLKG